MELNSANTSRNFYLDEGTVILQDLGLLVGLFSKSGAWSLDKNYSRKVKSLHFELWRLYRRLRSQLIEYPIPWGRVLRYFDFCSPHRPSPSSIDAHLPSICHLPISIFNNFHPCCSSCFAICLERIFKLCLPFIHFDHRRTWRAFFGERLAQYQDFLREQHKYLNCTQHSH